ncbi:MAG: alanine racemase, partial [Lachnospiraceae bacterium]
FTHFATADDADKKFTMDQLEAYSWVVDRLQELGVTFSYRHCSNSAGIIDIKEANFDMVRAGISTYGMYPSEEVIKNNVALKPALTLTSHIAFVKAVEAGTPISYGSTFVASEHMLVATIPVGYADGYARSLSGKGYVLIRGQRANIIGRICMDQFMVDVTAIKDVSFGDEVTLIGRNGDEVLPVEVLSDISGRFNYEFVCCLSKRIPREYSYHGKIEEQIDYFK